MSLNSKLVTARAALFRRRSKRIAGAVAATCEAIEPRTLFSAYAIFGPGNGTGQLALQSYAWGVSQPASSSGSLPSPLDFSFTAASGAATPGVLTAVAAGTVIEPLVVVETAPSPAPGGAEVEVGRWTLHHVVLTSYDHFDKVGAAPSDSFKASFTSFEHTHKAATGPGVNSVNYNFSTAKGSGSGTFPLTSYPSSTSGVFVNASGGGTALASGVAAVQSFSWGAARPTTPAGGSGGVAVPQDVKLTLSPGETTEEFLRSAIADAHWSSFTISSGTPAGERDHWTLRNAIVTSYSTGYSDATGPADSVTLAFDSIEVSDTSAGAASVSTSWDIPSGKGSGTLNLGTGATTTDPLVLSVDGGNGSIPLATFSWGAGNTTTLATPGRTLLSPFSLTGQRGPWSPWLVQKLVAGQVQTGLTLTQYDRTTHARLASWQLTDAIVSSYSTSAALLTNEPSKSESFSLSAGAVTQTVYDASGQPAGVATWSAEQNRGTGPTDFGGAANVVPSGTPIEVKFGAGTGSIAATSFAFATQSGIINVDPGTGNTTRSSATSGSFAVIAPTGAASASLLRAVEAGSVLPQVTVVLRDPASAGRPYARYTLGSVLVGSYNVNTLAGPAGDQFSLTPKTLTIDQFAADGVTVARESTYDYSIGRGTVGGSFPLTEAAVQPLLPGGNFLTATGPTSPLTAHGAVDVSDINWSAKTVGTVTGPDGFPAPGPGALDGATVTLAHYGAASLAMFDAVVNGNGHFDTLSLSVGAGTSTHRTHAVYTLHDAYVTTYASGATGGALTTDTFSLSFASLDYQLAPLDSKGIPGTPITGTWQKGPAPLTFGTLERQPNLNLVDFTPGTTGGEAATNSFSWGESRPAPTGTQGAPPSLTFDDATLTAPAAQASPALYEAIHDGRVIPIVTVFGDALAGSTEGDANAATDSRWTLTNVRVTSFKTQAGPDGSLADTFTLRFDAVSHTVVTDNKHPEGYTGAADTHHPQGAAPDFGGQILFRLVPDAPTITAMSFDWTVSPQRVNVTFSADVSASLASGDLLVARLGTGGAADVPFAVALLGFNAGTLTASWVPASGNLFPDGNYAATLPATAAADAFGSPLVAGQTISFFALMGDANRDRTVGPGDFNLLATAFGKPNQTWATGDFDFDHRVGPSDFNLLATAFGRSVPDPQVSVVAGGGTGSLAASGPTTRPAGKRTTPPPSRRLTPVRASIAPATTQKPATELFATTKIVRAALNFVSSDSLLDDGHDVVL